MDVTQLFSKAQQDVKTLTERPSNNDLLLLYAHFKQATEGDCTGDRPGMMDFVNRAKYDAWSKIKGMSKEQAMQVYTDKVNSLLSA